MLLVGDFGDGVAVESEEPVGLVETVLANEGWRFGGENGGGVGDGAVGGVIDAPHFVTTIKVVATVEDLVVVGVVGSDNHLGGLTGGGEGFGFGGAGDGFVAAGFFVFFDSHSDAAHGLTRAAEVLFGGESGETFLSGELDVDADAVGVFASLVDELLGGFGDGFEVDVAAEVMVFAQGAGNLVDLLHGVVGVANDAGAEEEAFDVVTLVEVESELYHFLRSEARAWGVAGAPVDAVVAVVNTGVGEENLEEGDAASVGGVAVADSCSAGGAEGFRILSRGVSLVGAATGAGGVVFGGVGENRELFLEGQKKGKLLP